MTQGLLQKTVEEQGASEAIGDKLCKKAVCLMDDIAALADRYYTACSAALKTVFRGLNRNKKKKNPTLGGNDAIMRLPNLF